MKYRKLTDNKRFSAKSHIDAYRKLCSELSIEGHRAIEAVADNGAIIRASLYLYESYIKNKNGVQIFKS